MSMKSAFWGLISVAALMGSGSVTAQAGQPYPAPPCAGPGPCDYGIHVLPSRPVHQGPVTVQHRTAFDHYKSIQFQQAPHVSILRVHGRPQTVGLSDAPSGFTGGCSPSSTRYCRSEADQTDHVIDVPSPTPHPVPAPQPLPLPKPYPVPKPSPIVRPVPLPRPIPAPCQPVHGPCGPQGVHPFAMSGASATTSTPSVVTIPAPMTSSMSSQTVPSVPPHMVSGSVIAAPLPTGSGYPQLAGGPVLSGPTLSSGPIASGTGASRYGIQPDGTYWEKVSGPTTVGGLTATEILCKRQVPGHGTSPVCRTPAPAQAQAQGRYGL